jgi:hypothetical protein
MTNKFSQPTEFRLEEITIDGKDVSNFFMSVAIYENIFIPAITGTVILIDTDGGGFLEQQGQDRVEFTEDISFRFTNALDEELAFDGHLTGLKNETTKDSKKVYAIDFASKVARENEQAFVTKRFNNVSPQDVVTEMLDKLGVEETNITGAGRNMDFVGSRKKPLDIVKYVLTHGIAEGQSAPRAADHTEGTPAESESGGLTGFLCWETLKEFRFATIDQLIQGEVGQKHTDFKRQLQNTSLSMDETMKGVIAYSFPRLADQQSKMRSGGYRNKVISFDMDKGHYVEYEYKDEDHMTEKQKEAVKFPTRFLWKPYTNEKFMEGCEKAQANTGDQSRLCLAQNTVRQNTFDDQLGEFTLPPRFDMNAGDSIEIKISKVKSEKEGGYDKKHSGNYVIKSLAHHITFDGRAYTKIATIRSTTQQDDNSSQ